MIKDPNQDNEKKKAKQDRINKRKKERDKVLRREKNEGANKNGKQLFNQINNDGEGAIRGDDQNGRRWEGRRKVKREGRQRNEKAEGRRGLAIDGASQRCDFAIRFFPFFLSPSLTGGRPGLLAFSLRQCTFFCDSASKWYVRVARRAGFSGSRPGGRAMLVGRERRKACGPCFPPFWPRQTNHCLLY